jgi:hypothetical protein
MAAKKGGNRHFREPLASVLTKILEELRLMREEQMRNNARLHNMLVLSGERRETSTNA